MGSKVYTNDVFFLFKKNKLGPFNYLRNFRLFNRLLFAQASKRLC